MFGQATGYLQRSVFLEQRQLEVEDTRHGLRIDQVDFDTLLRAESDVGRTGNAVFFDFFVHSRVISEQDVQSLQLNRN